MASKGPESSWGEKLMFGLGGHLAMAPIKKIAEAAAGGILQTSNMGRQMTASFERLKGEAPKLIQTSIEKNQRVAVMGGAVAACFALNYSGLSKPILEQAKTSMARMEHEAIKVAVKPDKM